MKSWRWMLATVAALAAGCSSAPAPIPVVGAPADVRTLAGEWGGDYHSENNGRSGSIVFRLSAQADTAFGDVVMIPRGTDTPRPSPPSVGLPMPPAPEVLSIAFVSAANGGVSGQLRPYRDPECDCQLSTTFEGRVKGDVIEGTYSSVRVGQGGPPQTGSWKVTKKKT